MARRRFSEREVIETLIYQGVTVPCYRCNEPLGIHADALCAEREHLHEIALGGKDEPLNCRYSHAKCHAVVTNGAPATTAGSSKHRIAKTKGTRAAKFAVVKKALDEPRTKPQRFGNTTFRPQR